MNPIEFQRKWIGVELKERSASQEHFLDLCRVLGHPTPAELDPTGEVFTLERVAAKSIGSNRPMPDGAGRHIVALSLRG